MKVGGYGVEEVICGHIMRAVKAFIGPLAFTQRQEPPGSFPDLG